MKNVSLRMKFFVLLGLLVFSSCNFFDHDPQVIFTRSNATVKVISYGNDKWFLKSISLEENNSLSSAYYPFLDTTNTQTRDFSVYPFVRDSIKPNKQITSFSIGSFLKDSIHSDTIFMEVWLENQNGNPVNFDGELTKTGKEKEVALKMFKD